MKLNVQACAIAVGIVTAVAYLLCAALIALSPNVAWNFYGFLLHMNAEGLVRSIGWLEYFVGLIVWVAAMMAISAFTAWLYNRLSARTGA